MIDSRDREPMKVDLCSPRELTLVIMRHLRVRFAPAGRHRLHGSEENAA